MPTDDRRRALRDLTQEAVEAGTYGEPAPSDLRGQIIEALTAEHYRRAKARIVASPEEHCAAMAAAVLAIVGPELGRLRAELDESSDALCAVGKAALVVRPTLAKPYPDAPETSPWQQFMERPARTAYNLGKRIHRGLKEAPDA